MTAAPSNLDVNNALLTAWVSTSADQQQIVRTGMATAAQKANMQCTYPFTAELMEPCFVYNDTLDPNETYYVWSENNNA